MVELLILGGLILLNGFFSMAEIAIISSRKARLEAQAEKGDIKAKEALQLAAHPDKFLSTVQIGITLIGILTGLFSGESMKGDLIHFFNQFDVTKNYSNTIATTAVVIVITYLTLILGELLPKRIGLANPELIAKFVAKPMKIISAVTYPFIWLLSHSTNLLVRLFNIKTKESQVTEEEIKAIINEGTEHGAIEEAEQEIIERIFHLGDRNITSIMTHRSDIVWFGIQDTEEMVKAKIGNSLHSTYPICDGEIDNIKGIVYVKELYLSPDNIPFEKTMKPALFVPENNTAYQVLEKFKQTKTHCCFIVDEYGTLLGMITLNDILEAIVGDMPEPEADDYKIVERKDGSFLIDAQISFYDFLSHFDKTTWMNEGEHEFDTLAGFILHELEHIPRAGETFIWKDFEFEIVDMDGHRIDKVLVKIQK